ncbi:D-tyrosyl-tRNA(Tyr) deacylase [bacterium]|nr:D-tyrosyl-tRNA(Tyr) deacylase [candidate division CSSED10-310 bacterium]
MIAVVQRVVSASVNVDGETIGRIGNGLLVLVGVAETDTIQDAEFLVRKITGLRIFNDHLQKMNRSLVETSGALLVISQFTLLGDCRKGRRPSFNRAARPDHGHALYDVFIDRCRAEGIPTETGRFGAMMQVSLVNDGPVTLILESDG